MAFGKEVDGEAVVEDWYGCSESSVKVNGKVEFCRHITGTIYCVFSQCTAR